MRLLLIVLALMGATAGAGGWYYVHKSTPHTNYMVAELKRGDLLASIDSTGTLEPEEVVDVGAQVAGLIESFGKDANGKTIDYRSPVRGEHGAGDDR